MQNNDHYSLLGVAPEADTAAIRKAYHRLALLHHPDRNPGDAGAAERFRQISEAYRILSDPEKRRAYDRPLRSMYDAYSEQSALHAFLEVKVDRISAKLNEEIELVFEFGPDGRFFKKPDLRGWFLAAGPFVDHKIVRRSGQTMRETTLRYTVCPMRTGNLIIPPASIRYNEQECRSKEVRLRIDQNVCYFRKGEEAGANPMRVYLHKEQLSSQTIYAKVMLHQHVVLIPRSDMAAWYHKVGRILKIGMAACGAGVAFLQGESTIAGFVLGSAFGGLNCHAMYRVMGIKSRFYYANHHPLVLEYLQDGYLPGSEPNEGFLGSKRWNFIKSLFL
jgi:hypothetical protein